MSRHPPTIAVVSDDHRVGRALVAYLSSDGSAAAQVIGPYTYHADQEQFRHAEAILCDLDGCDLAAAFDLVQRVAAARIPVVAISASAAVRTQALARGATACADKSAVALEELVRQLADAPLATRPGYVICRTHRRQMTGTKTSPNADAPAPPRRQS